MRWTSTALILGVAVLTGCASLRSVDSDVSSYSQWPQERRPAAYAFERLPSQLARPQEQAQIESLARAALAEAGFTEVRDERDANVTIQVSVRIVRNDRAPYDDPFFRGGFLYGSRWGRPFWGPGFMGGYDGPRFDREVAVLVRDRKSNQPLFEAHAVNDGVAAGGDELLTAMFRAAMKDFPQSGINPRRVTIQLPPLP